MKPDPEGWFHRIFYGALDRPWATLRAGLIVAVLISAIAISLAIAVLVIEVALNPTKWLG